MKKDVNYLYECDDLDFSEKEELKEDSLYDEKLEKFLKKLEKKLHSEHQFHSIYGIGKNKIIVEIEWGDWKHEHMFTDDIVEEFLNEHGINIVSQSNITTEDDGSDTYSSRHIYILDRSITDDDLKESVEPDVADKLEAIYSKAEEIYKSSEITADVLHKIASQYFDLDPDELENFYTHWQRLESQYLDEAFDLYADIKEDEWEPEDIELHKSIDWKARNYEDYPVEDDSFEGEVVAYRGNGEEKAQAKFIKYLRANPIFTPYYAPVDRPFDNVLSSMFDGRMHGKYMVMDRFESQDVYDRLSENYEVVDMFFDILVLPSGSEKNKSNLDHYDTFIDKTDALEIYDTLIDNPDYDYVEVCKIEIDEQGKYHYTPIEATDDYLTESLKDNEIQDFFKKAKEIGIETLGDLKRFLDTEKLAGESDYQAMSRYRSELGDDFTIVDDKEDIAVTLDEGAMSELDIDIKNAGGAEEYLIQVAKQIAEKEDEIDTLEFHIAHLGQGFFDTRDMKELEDDLAKAKDELHKLEAKAQIVRGL